MACTVYVCVCVCVSVSVDDWVAKLQSERVCPYLGQPFLARMQCDTVTILMPNTYSITHSAKIWYPYRFFFFSFSLHSVLHISFHYFGFTFSFLFHTYIVFRCMFPLCFTKDARLLYHFIIRISFSFLIFCMLFFFCIFLVFVLIVMHSGIYIDTLIHS